MKLAQQQLVVVLCEVSCDAHGAKEYSGLRSQILVADKKKMRETIAHLKNDPRNTRKTANNAIIYSELKYVRI